MLTALRTLRRQRFMAGSAPGALPQTLASHACVKPTDKAPAAAAHVRGVALALPGGAHLGAARSRTETWVGRIAQAEGSASTTARRAV
jgi:hypothetical protein